MNLKIIIGTAGLSGALAVLSYGRAWSQQTPSASNPDTRDQPALNALFSEVEKKDPPWQVSLNQDTGNREYRDPAGVLRLVIGPDGAILFDSRARRLQAAQNQQGAAPRAGLNALFPGDAKKDPPLKMVSYEDGRREYYDQNGVLRLSVAPNGTITYDSRAARQQRDLNAQLLKKMESMSNALGSVIGAPAAAARIGQGPTSNALGSVIGTAAAVPIGQNSPR